MRFPAAATAIIAALPALSAAQENPLDQYKAQFRQVLKHISSYIPNPGRFDSVGAHEAKTGPMKLSVLTLENWRETLYEPVAPDAKAPEEWWVLISGRNKTCFGRCLKAEGAFNETARKFAELLPNSPHMGLVNCDDQPILCNTWSASVGNIWAIDMLPKPAPIDIYKRRLNLTTVTADDLVKLYEAGHHKGFVLLDSWFHPFNGKAVELGLSVPLGYLFWVFGLVPNWLFMLVVTFASRAIMGNRIQQQQTRRPAGAPTAAAAQRK